MKHTIHVHQQRMRQGAPAIIDRTYKRSTHHTHLHIVCPNCEHIAAEVVQTVEPDACGAHITIHALKTLGDGQNAEESP